MLTETETQEVHRLTLEHLEHDICLRMRAASAADDWEAFDRLTEELAAIDRVRRMRR